MEANLDLSCFLVCAISTPLSSSFFTFTLFRVGSSMGSFLRAAAEAGRMVERDIDDVVVVVVDVSESLPSIFTLSSSASWNPLGITMLGFTIIADSGSPPAREKEEKNKSVRKIWEASGSGRTRSRK